MPELILLTTPIPLAGLASAVTSPHSKEAVFPDGSRCPSCGSALERAHRHALDRWVSIFRSVHRYRCTSPACGWVGLLGRESGAAALRGRPLWTMRLLWFAIGAVFAVAAVEGTRLALRAKAESERIRPLPTAAGARSAAMAPGHDFDGEPLPARDERQVRNKTPLNLRRSCAWGVPGGNPYRGTVEQALVAAQLPGEVVKKISEMAERGWTHGQVEISRDGIRTVDRRRYFGTRASMAFGSTMCFDTRVNFKPGHVEYAAYYEAADNRGQTYSVMVPYVCQNVAVLGERYEEENGKTSAPSTASVLLLALALLGWQQWQRRRTGQR